MLAGDGPDRVALQALAAKLHVHARFTGTMSQAQVRDLLTETDVLVAPGLAEGLPASIIEAFATRVPVVASQLAGVPEVVVDGVSGRLVPPGNEVALRRRDGGAAHAGPDRPPPHVGRHGARRPVEREFDMEREAARLAELFTG